MYIVTSRRRETGQVESRHVDSHPRVLAVGLALLDRGDELISISVTNGAFPVTPEDIQTARAARARYAAQGVRYNEELAALLSVGVRKASLSVSSIITPESSQRRVTASRPPRREERPQEDPRWMRPRRPGRGFALDASGRECDRTRQDCLGHTPWVGVRSS